MKRSELIQKLVNEGMSHKTLVNFTDKQLTDLSQRMLDEQVTVTQSKPTYKIGQGGGKLPQSPTGYVVSTDPTSKTTTAVQAESEVKEELKGKQKKIDKNHNGKIDGQDFKILRGQKKKKEDMKEADMGLTVKVPKSSGSVFGTPVKGANKPSTPKKKSAPKKKEKTSEEGDMDESLHGLMIGVTKDKLKKDLGRDPEDHEINKEIEKFVDSWKKDNESKSETPKKSSSSKEKDVDELNLMLKLDKKKKGEEEKKKDEKKKEEKKCEHCGKNMKDCECDHDHLEESKGIKKLKLDKLNESELKTWIENLIREEKLHIFTSKNEIMELIKTKLTEQPEIMEPDIDIDTDIDTDTPEVEPFEEPDYDPYHDPYDEPGNEPDPRPKMSDEDSEELPDYMKYDNIMSLKESIKKMIKNGKK